MNTDIFLLTPEEATNLANDLNPITIPQLACTPASVVCAGVVAVGLYIVIVWSYAVVVNIAVVADIFCWVIGPRCG